MSQYSGYRLHFGNRKQVAVAAAAAATIESKKMIACESSGSSWAIYFGSSGVFDTMKGKSLVWVGMILFPSLSLALPLYSSVHSLVH